MVGDLVWVADGSVPKGNLPTSRFVELRFGSDYVACSAAVKTSSGTLVRPLVNLVPIFNSEDVANANLFVFICDYFYR